MHRPISCRLAFAGLAIFFAARTAPAEDVPRVYGTIQQMEGDIYVVKSRNGSELRLVLATGSAVAVSVNTALHRIHEGSYLGVAGMAQPDGRQRAVEVQIFHETLRGAAEGHWPWDLQSLGTITYGTAWQVVSTADGDSATLYYKDGQKRILIPSDTPVVTYVLGSRTDLRPGATIYVPAAARRPDGLLEANYVMLGSHDAPLR